MTKASQSYWQVRTSIHLTVTVTVTESITVTVTRTRTLPDVSKIASVSAGYQWDRTNTNQVSIFEATRGVESKYKYIIGVG